tara:strand:- start:200 stop:640 length:441 start_codon:yes stop_codon:yes gene_type:complete
MWIGGDSPNRNLLKSFIKFKKVAKTDECADLIVQFTNEENKTKSRNPLRKFLSNSYTNLINFIFNLNIPYYNGQSIYNKKYFNPKKLCNSRFILAEIFIETFKHKPKIHLVEHKLNKNDKDISSESLSKLINTTLKDLIKYKFKKN